MSAPVQFITLTASNGRILFERSWARYNAQDKSLNETLKRIFAIAELKMDINVAN